MRTIVQSGDNPGTVQSGDGAKMYIPNLINIKIIL